MEINNPNILSEFNRVADKTHSLHFKFFIFLPHIIRTESDMTETFISLNTVIRYQFSFRYLVFKQLKRIAAAFQMRNANLSNGHSDNLA